METKYRLPDPKICRTRQLFDTPYYLCLVADHINCPQLNIIRGEFLCNHSFRSNFAVEEAID
jgi:hypothetical protein